MISNMKLFILLVLPAIAVARISVEVNAGSSEQDRSVNCYGNQVDIISQTEINTFRLGDDSLKNAVNAYFGKRPDDAYLKSPTPWGDLYQTYNWDQVTRTLVPRSARILQVASEPVIVMKQSFQNNSTKEATFDVAISQSVENKVSSTWSTGGDLTVGLEVSYEINVEAATGGGSTSVSYTNSWGSSTEKSETVTVGSSSGMNVVLKPGQSVMAELHATRGYMLVEVQYDAFVSGATAINYSTPYRGHHFWALPVDGVMKAGGISNSVQSKEVIKTEFYSNSKIIVNDMDRMRTMFKAAL